MEPMCAQMNYPDHRCLLEQTHKLNGQRRHADDAAQDPEMSTLTYLHTDAGSGRIKEPIFVIEEQKESEKSFRASLKLNGSTG